MFICAFAQQLQGALAQGDKYMLRLYGFIAMPLVCMVILLPKLQHNCCRVCMN